MTRRELRENTFKMLFHKEFHNVDEMEEQCVLFMDNIENVGMDEKDSDYIHSKVFDIIAHLTEIDEAIEAVSEGWKLGRMGRVDITILRLAYYEIKFDDTIPDVVAINEAVEIAKKFGGEDSPSFVNGILAKLV